MFHLLRITSLPSATFELDRIGAPPHEIGAQTTSEVSINICLATRWRRPESIATTLELSTFLNPTSYVKSVGLTSIDTLPTGSARWRVHLVEVAVSSDIVE